MDDAVRIVSLQRDGAVAEDASGALAAAIPVVGLGPLHHLFSVQTDGDCLVLHDDEFREPLIVLRDSLDILGADILHVIKTAAFDGVADEGIVHLYFEALLRKTSVLKLGVE